MKHFSIDSKHFRPKADEIDEAENDLDTDVEHDDIGGSDFPHNGDTDPDARANENDNEENDLATNSEHDDVGGGSVDDTEQPLDTENLVLFCIFSLLFYICQDMFAPNDNVIDPDAPTRGLSGQYSKISERQFYRYRMAMRENKKGAFHWLWSVIY